MKHILHIHSENRYTWIQLSETGEILAAQEINHLAALGSTQPKDQWLILLPGQHVLMTAAHLPKSNKRELLKAVPFALEEQLTTEVDKLYFAYGDLTKEKNLAVGVIDKKILETYLRLLKSYDISPTVMLPDFLAIPYVENRWSVVIDDEMALVRTGKQSGFATYHNNIRLLLQLTLDKHKDNLPEKLNVYNISKSNRKNLQFANHQVPLENIAAKNPFIYLQTMEEPPINLLGGQYRHRAPLKLTHKTRHWLYVGILAASWIVALVGSKVAAWYDLKIHLNRLQTQITQNYQQVFPGATVADDPRNKIEHELNALTLNSQGSHFTHLLSHTSVVLHRYPTIHLHAINYQQNQLVLQLNTDNITTLENLAHALSQQGFSVKQNQMNSDNKNITAELMIK